MTRGNYVYFAQSREHPSDPMYGVARTRLYELTSAIAGREADYIIFRYNSFTNACKVISL